MKKKARPASAKKTVKKSPAKKPATKKKVATKGLKKSKGKAYKVTEQDGEITPPEAIGRQSTHYVNVLNSELINDGSQLRLTLQAKSGGEITFFGFRVEDKDGELLEFVGDPDWDPDEKVKLTFNVPQKDHGVLELSDYSVVILTKKKITR